MPERMLFRDPSDTAPFTRFAKRHGITFSWEDVGPEEIPWSDEWHQSARNYLVRLRRSRHYMTLYYSKGEALQDEPKIGEILQSLSADANLYEQSDGKFEEFAELLGVDIDSREEEKNFRYLEAQVKQLKGFLGQALYGELVQTPEGT